MDTSNWIDMSSKYRSTLSNIDVQQSTGWIHRSSSHVVSSSINIDAPNGLAVVFECKSACGMHKIPDFNCTITWPSQKMMSSGMETHGTDPILMALARHNQLRLVNSPYLPEHIIASSSNDGFLGMEYNRDDSHGMSLLSFTKYSLFIVECIHNLRRFFFGKRSKLNFFVIGHVGLGINLRQLLFFGLSF